MIIVKNVTFDDESSKLVGAIRQEVFIREQGIDPELEFDGLDDRAIHALVYADGVPVATGRILDDGHIGRIAVLREYRGQGLGEKVVLSLINKAEEKGCSRVYLGSQTQATNFYLKLGFSPYGSEFMEAGIPHMWMERLLQE